MTERIDFHTHILPGVDDGSKSVEESLAMLRLSAEQGIGHMIATPHFYAHHDNPENFFARREKAFALLRDAMAEEPGLPRITLGAEVYYFNGISNTEVLRDLAIGQSEYVLIEMPAPPWTEKMYRELENITRKQGLIPVIAHVDRYVRPLKTFGIPRRLEQMQLPVQANASFFLYTSTARMAMKMLRQNRIHLLGSDCHNMEGRRPNLGQALELIEKKLGAEVLSRIAYHQTQILEQA